MNKPAELAYLVWT